MNAQKKTEALLQRKEKATHTQKPGGHRRYTRGIICSAHGKGREHDFALFKRSELKVDESIELLADKGYQGIKALHENSFIPIKKKKGQKLSKEERDYNRDIGRKRICIEHVNGRLKRFRILAGLYRNRRRGFGRRFNLIAAICNLLLLYPY